MKHQVSQKIHPRQTLVWCSMFPEMLSANTSTTLVVSYIAILPGWYHQDQLALLLSGWWLNDPSENYSSTNHPKVIGQNTHVNQTSGYCYCLIFPIIDHVDPLIPSVISIKGSWYMIPNHPTRPRSAPRNSSIISGLTRGAIQWRTCTELRQWLLAAPHGLVQNPHRQHLRPEC